jgi:hypothetical protein
MSGAEVANLYDVRLGRPSSAMRNQWQSSCRELMKAKKRKRAIVVVVFD